MSSSPSISLSEDIMLHPWSEEDNYIPCFLNGSLADDSILMPESCGPVGGQLLCLFPLCECLLWRFTGDHRRAWSPKQIKWILRPPAKSKIIVWVRGNWTRIYIQLDISPKFIRGVKPSGVATNCQIMWWWYRGQLTCQNWRISSDIWDENKRNTKFSGQLKFYTFNQPSFTFFSTYKYWQNLKCKRKFLNNRSIWATVPSMPTED